MSYQPLVSIIIPVYNGANYVGHAIECALAQTYQNVEIIVVNDGSTDDGATEAVVKQYTSDKIRYFAKENGGVSTALNFAIEKMNGEWFSWLSHDDAYYPNKIERQVEALNSLAQEEKIPVENIVIYGANEIIDSEGNVILHKKHTVNNQSGTIDLLLDNIHDYKICGCAVLVHKSKLQKIGGFNAGIRTISDAECFYRLILEGLRFYWLDDVLVQSRQHKRQVGKEKAQLFHEEGDNFHLWILDRILENEEWVTPNNLLRFYAGVTKRGYEKASKKAKESLNKKFGKQYSFTIFTTKVRYTLLGKVRSVLRWIYRSIFVK